MYTSINQARSDAEFLYAKGYTQFGVYMDPDSGLFYVLTIAGPNVRAGYLLVR